MILFNSKTPDYAWLSNFWPVLIQSRLTYRSAEAAYQAAKCADPADQERFVGVDALSAKRLGRRIKMRDDWDKVKVAAMRKVLALKFKNEVLRAQLKATGAEPLVHLSPWDRFWGVDNAGHGENVLGRLLEELRAEL